MDCDPLVMTEREKDDDTLARFLIVDAAAKAKLRFARSALYGTLLVFLGAWVLLKVHLVLGVTLLVGGPPGVAVYNYLRAARDSRITQGVFNGLPMWERYRINLIIERAADRRQGHVL